MTRGRLRRAIAICAAAGAALAACGHYGPPIRHPRAKNTGPAASAPTTATPTPSAPPAPSDATGATPPDDEGNNELTP